MASSGSISSRVVSELRYQGWRSAGRVPARLQGGSSWIGSIAVDWITINEVANLCVGASSCGIGDTAWYLDKYKYKYIRMWEGKFIKNWGFVVMEM